MEKVIKKRDWHGRNYPKRGTTISTPVREMGLHPDTLVYIGNKNGSGFVWIGPYKDVPEKYLDRTVLETYRRTVDYPGEVLLIDGKAGNGPYWMWSECDKTVEPLPMQQIDSRGIETLLIAIIRDEAHDYRNKLRYALKGKHDPDVVKKIIKNVKKVHGERLSFLTGTSQGDYIIQRTEDEAFVIATHPELQNIPYDRRYEIISKEVQKLISRRVKAGEDQLYAHIKGRSVKHESAASKKRNRRD